MTMPDLGRPDLTPALPSLDWSAWSNLAGIRRGATIPNVPGLYRVRRIGATAIDYIGQTGGGWDYARPVRDNARGRLLGRCYAAPWAGASSPPPFGHH
jgi:hypothetical protein